jgi:hypothetical protein
MLALWFINTSNLHARVQGNTGIVIDLESRA